jgi:hypothetical protein
MIPSGPQVPNGLISIASPRSREAAELVSVRVKGAQTITHPWVQEIGAPEPFIPAADAPEFAGAEPADLLRSVGRHWWCSHDVDRALADFPELEYTLGLLGNDRRRKPLAEAYAGLTRLTHQPVSRPVAPPADPAGRSSRPGWPPPATASGWRSQRPPRRPTRHCSRRAASPS